MKRLNMIVALPMLTALQLWAATGVTVTVNDDHSVVLSNGVLTINVNPKGKITGCFFNDEDLFGKQGTIYFSCNQPNYSELKATKVEVVRNSDDYAEILYTNELPKNIKWSQGYIIRKGVNGIYSYVVTKGGTWTVEFDLDKTYDGDAYLTISAAGVTNKPRFNILVNGQDVGREEYDLSDASLYRSGVQSGIHELRIHTFPASLLKQGKNTIAFQLYSVKEKGGLMWDCLKLETGKEVK